MAQKEVMYYDMYNHNTMGHITQLGQKEIQEYITSQVQGGVQGERTRQQYKQVQRLPCAYKACLYSILQL